MEQGLRKEILEGTIQVYNRKGLKFTMDDIAAWLGISKKTIYTVFETKEALFLTMVDYLFDSIKESEAAVVENPALGTLEKIKRILGVMPESYRNIDFRQLYELKGNGRRGYPPCKDSVGKNDAGGSYRTVFPERYSDSTKSGVSGGVGRGCGYPGRRNCK